METKEKLTIQEIEQLCLAYIDCHLSRFQEKELELVLLCSDLTSPIIDEVRDLMGLSTLMAIPTSKVNNINKSKLIFFKYSGIAACIAVIVLFSSYFFIKSTHREMTPEIYVYADGKVLTGYAAQAVVRETENETMNMFRSILEDVEDQQRLNNQYINDLIN